MQVADARNLRRALMLTAQIAAFGKPMVLALNMVDEAFARGISIDAAALAAELGIPVVEMVAVEGRGFSELRDALASRGPAQMRRRDATPLDRAAWAHDLTAARPPQSARCHCAYVQEALARATRRPLTGLPILAVVLYALYLFVGVFGAQTLVKLLEDGVFGRGINPASIWLVDRFIPIPFVRDFLVGQYGLITMGLTYAIAIVLPVVATFFLMFGFLEDSGYIPRLAIFCDRIFRVMGLNGKAVLPMVLGLGCDTMATMTTRILGTPKERLIAILLLALGIPCSAQLATILGILGGISFAALATLFARRARPDVPGRLAGGARAEGRAVGVHPGAAADPLAAARQPADQDAPARLVVPRRGRAAVSRRDRAAVRPRSARRARVDLARRRADRDRAARAAARDRADSGDGIPAPRLRRRRAVPARAQRTAHRRAGGRRADGDDAVRAVRRELSDDGARARAESRPRDSRRHHAGRDLHGSGVELCPACSWRSVLSRSPLSSLAVGAHALVSRLVESGAARAPIGCWRSASRRRGR